MSETGIARFPGSLDPRAEEFKPRNVSTTPNHITIFTPPPPQLPAHVYYPYTSGFQPINDVQVLPFCDASVGYPQFSSPPPYVSHPAVNMRQLPPPSATVATRALLLSSVPIQVTETTIRNELEVFGEVRGVEMESVCEGIVSVHFYDLRHAEMALKEIRDQHMQQQTRLRNHYASLLVQNSGNYEPNLASNITFQTVLHSSLPPPLPPTARGLIAGQTVWAQFIIPAYNAVPEGHNQGTIVIFNLDSDVSSSTLKDNFQAFGAIKELRETPSKKHQKFIEFFDVRDSAKALKEMNGKVIYGKQVVIEFSRPGGHTRKFLNSTSNPTAMNSLSQSLYPRGARYPPQPPPPPPPPPPPSLFQRHLSSRSPLNAVASHSYGSQQTHFSTRKFHNYGKSSNYNGIGNNKGRSNNSVEKRITSLSLSIGGDSGNVISEEKGLQSHGPASKMLSRKNQDNNNNIQPSMVASKQQQEEQQPRNRPRKGRQTKKIDSRFQINEDALLESNCRDSRTTVMIKNIPNKYSQKLLLNMLDNHCIHCNEQIANRGDDQPLSSYDFVYLPIDFNNKCNVGYGFVNMTTPEATWRLYKAFHQQHWEVFNSRKICEVTYARVQGLEGLKEHFRNSKFPCEMDHYLPVVFTPPRDGRQLTEPLPIVGPNRQSSPVGLQLLINSSSPKEDCDNDTLDAENTIDHNVCHLRSEELLLLMGDNSGGYCSSSLNGGVESHDENDEQHQCS